MAKHAADNGGFFGLFKKKKEGYYDFTDTARTNKKSDDYSDSIYSDLKRDYTVLDHTDIEDNGADIANNNTTSLNNLVSNGVSSAKVDTGISGEKESTQAVNTIEEVSANTQFNGKLYQTGASTDSRPRDVAAQTNSTSNYSYSNDVEDGTFVNGYEYDYQDYEDESNIKNIKKILIIIAIVLVVAAVAFYLLFIKGKNNTDELPVEEETTEVVQEKMISSLSGFTVLGKLDIEAINVEQYILNSTSDEALNSGVGKIENGATLNTNGNFCIAGHNREGVFKDLNNLIEGTEIKITDPNLNESTYVVKELREVSPDNLEVLLQDMTKEVITLITCKEGATERNIVIAARK